MATSTSTPTMVIWETGTGARPASLGRRVYAFCSSTGAVPQENLRQDVQSYHTETRSERCSHARVPTLEIISALPRRCMDDVGIDASHDSEISTIWLVFVLVPRKNWRAVTRSNGARVGCTPSLWKDVKHFALVLLEKPTNSISPPWCFFLIEKIRN